MIGHSQLNINRIDRILPHLVLQHLKAQSPSTFLSRTLTLPHGVSDTLTLAHTPSRTISPLQPAYDVSLASSVPDD